MRGDVVGDAAAGDVGEALDEARLDGRSHRPQVRAVGPEELVAHRAAELFDVRIHVEPQGLEDDAPRQRVAVRVQARRRQAHEHVARDDAASVDEALPIRESDHEAGEVVLAGGAYIPGISAVSPPSSAQPFARHPSATPAMTGGRHVRAQRAGSEVVEEEERSRALHQDVVHAVVDEVDADGVVAAGGEGHLQLGADAVPRSPPGPARPGPRGPGGTRRRTRRCPRARRRCTCCARGRARAQRAPRRCRCRRPPPCSPSREPRFSGRGAAPPTVRPPGCAGPRAGPRPARARGRPGARSPSRPGARSPSRPRRAVAAPSFRIVIAPGALGSAARAILSTICM